MKLADVYFVENNHLGTWAEIGYNGPNGSNGSSSASTNFTYGANTYTANNGNGSTATWGAYNNVALNDCTAGSGTDVWTVTPTVSDGAVSWAADVLAASKATCGILTPNFDKIGK